MRLNERRDLIVLIVEVVIVFSRPFSWFAVVETMVAVVLLDGIVVLLEYRCVLVELMKCK